MGRGVETHNIGKIVTSPIYELRRGRIADGDMMEYSIVGRTAQATVKHMKYMKKLLFFIILALVASVPQHQLVQAASALRTKISPPACKHQWASHNRYVRRGNQWYVMSGSKCRICGIVWFRCGTLSPIQGIR